MSLKNGDIALSVFDYYKTYPIVSENNYINPVRYTVKNSTDLSVDLTIDLYYAAQQTTFTVDVSATIVEGRMLLIKNTVNGEATDSFSVSFCGGQEIQSTAPDSSTSNPRIPQVDTSKQVADLQKKEVARLRRVEINLGNFVDEVVGQVAKRLVRNRAASYAVGVYVEKSKEKRKQYVETRGETDLEYHNKREIEVHALHCSLYPDDDICH
jgi:hypothetical protein